jgi:hypothetical protein
VLKTALLRFIPLPLLVDLRFWVAGSIRWSIVTLQERAIGAYIGFATLLVNDQGQE